MKIFKQLFQEQNIMQDPVAQNGLNSYGLEWALALQAVAPCDTTLAFAKASRTRDDLADGLPFHVAWLPLNPV